MSKFIEVKANKNSISHRKPIIGIGVNDAIYNVVTHAKGKTTTTCPFYLRWKSMIDRCYNVRTQIKYPHYKDCTVCDEWLLFSNFREWMEKQDWQGKEIDKDILKIGNKIYSPEFCIFVSREVNILLSVPISSKGKYPTGVNFIKEHTHPYQSRCNYNGKRKNLGYFETIAEAEEAYKKCKREAIIIVAQKQTDKRVHDGLLRHAELVF